MPITTERGKIAHLLRRAGFSPSAAELDAAVAKGLTATVEELLNPESVPDDAETLFPSSAIDYTRPQTIPLWWQARMVTTKRPLQEKMTLFWHSHLTSGLGRVGQLRFTMVAQNEFFRKNALGNFRDIVLGAAKDPAMILWLDNNTNRKGKPNENFARELFELFTLGRDQYTEQDIREAARAFTGWFQRDGVFLFTAREHDTDSKTIFGKSGNFDGGDVVNMAAAHPAAGPFITKKLWSFFAYPNPDAALVKGLADIYYGSGYDMRAVMRAILTHPEFYTERAYHALIKSPTEMIVGFLRSTEAQIDAFSTPESMLQLANQFGVVSSAMGQTLFNPPNVAGWPGGADWVSTTALITRYNFAAAASRDAYAATTTKPGDVLAKRGLTTAAQIVDFYTELMIDSDLTTAQRQTLLDYMVTADNGTTGAFKLDDATITKKVRGLIYLLATAPQYQLA